MTIDKRINFRGGGKYDTYQGGSKAPGSAEAIPNRITYTSENIDSKPVTGNDYRRSENEFIDNFNQNEASRFEPTFFNRNYDPISSNQFGSSNQPLSFGNAGMGGILSLITGNPLASLAYRGYNSLKDKIPQFNLNQNVNQDVNQELEDNTYYQKLIAQRDNLQALKLEALKNKANELTGVESVQAVGSDFPLNIQEIQGLIDNSQTEGSTGLSFQEIQSLIDNSRNNLG